MRSRDFRAALPGVSGVACAVLLFSSSAQGAGTVDPRNFAPTNIGPAIARANLRSISMLPPVTNPGYGYELDETLGTYVAKRDNLGSGLLDAARFTNKGSFQLAYSFAYYKLETMDGDDGRAIIANIPTGGVPASVDVGLAARVTSRVYVHRFQARYTLLDRFSVGFDLPLLQVDVSSRYLAQGIFDQAGRNSFLNRGVFQQNKGDYSDPAVLYNDRLNRASLAGGFSEGRNVDIGNVTLDAKCGFSNGIPGLTTGFLSSVRLPTASERRFTGTETTSLKGVLLADYRHGPWGIYLNGGYEHDFNRDNLSNAVLGASTTYSPAPPLIIELAARANLYEQDIDIFNSGDFGKAKPGARVTGGSGRIGRNEATVLGGFRFNPAGDLTVSAYMGGPITPDGYRSNLLFFFAMDYVL